MSQPASAGYRTSIESLDVIVAQVLDDLARRGNEPELPTGLPALDEAIWGLHRGEVLILAARPGEGKTTLALQIARYLAERHRRVLFVSLEMTRQQLAERFLIQLTQMDAWALRTGQQVEALIEKLKPLQGFLKTVNLRIVDGVGYTMAQLQHLVNQVVEHGGGPPDLLIIDFIQLIAMEGGMQKFDAIAEYLRSLKELAVRYNMALIVCSQINRESSKNAKARPKLENLKGSGTLEELADVVLLCWWQELGTEENPEGTKYWILVEKQRNGPPGQMIPVRFEKEKLTFHAVEEPVAAWGADKAQGGTVEV